MYWKQSDSEDVERIEALHGGVGTVMARRFFESESRLPVRVFVWELPAGAAWGVHSHPDDEAQEEILYCLSGHGTAEADGEDIPVGPGEALLLAQGSVHGFRNDGPAPLKLLLVLGRPTDP